MKPLYSIVLTSVFVFSSNTSTFAVENLDERRRDLVESAFEGQIIEVDKLRRELGSWEIKSYKAFAFGSKRTTADRLIGEKASSLRRGEYRIVDTWTPLTAALVNKQIDTAIYIIGAGADVNHMTDAGYSPLWLTVAHCEENERTARLVKLLLHKGADPNARPREVISPHDLVSPFEMAKGKPLLLEPFEELSAEERASPQ